ncbi:uncharacterized protein E0L32_005817 [Thyridium curvatum]|uniref:DUF7136 domain-containing protein n=1 Tax=Thyridium curvatum TaxID=1093900 RepID=A0A507B1X0_9PEZI|nr:uncharacterized protein E0L32_005817 [Thyridium curvatum]TPX13873.1 hypothetical protein E0L32_005817 [Thyridium curvatum]
MRLASRSMWTLTGACVCLGAVTRAAGVLDIGLVFPRTNGAYSLMDDFPIVFALQNSKLAEHLKPSIWYRILNVTGDIEALVDSTHEFNGTSASQNDPYFLWSHIKVQGEGKLPLAAALVVIKEGGEKADLVATTNKGNSEACPNEGVGIDVTDKTLEAQRAASSAREACAVLGTSSPTSTSNPCKAKIDKATVESMEAADLEKKCRGLNPPSECPKGGFASPRLATTGRYAHVLDSGEGCNDNPMSKDVHNNAANAIPVCRNSRLYYPVVSEDDTRLSKCESSGGPGTWQITCPDSEFSAAKDIGSLRDGDLGRLIKEDIVKGALVSLADNDRTNEYINITKLSDEKSTREKTVGHDAAVVSLGSDEQKAISQAGTRRELCSKRG